MSQHAIDASWIHTSQALYLATIASALAILISLWNICMHLCNYTVPHIQLYAVRILVIVPVYCVSSCIAIAVPGNGLYAETLRDVYEAFVIYSFLGLVLEYCGGEYQCILRLRHEPMLKHPWPLSRLKPMVRDARLIRKCKQGVLQFVLIKPVFAIISMVMIPLQLYFNPGYQAFMLLVYNVSYAIALYSLFIFYLATKVLLTQFKPVMKFVAVKSIVFATYYQSVLVRCVPMTTEEVYLWNDLLLCLEMVGFAIILAVAFSHKEYVYGIPDTSFLNNVKEVLNVRDIVQDVYHNFMPSYQDYALQRGADDASSETVRLRTFVLRGVDGTSQTANGKRLTHSQLKGVNAVLTRSGGKAVKAKLRRRHNPWDSSQNDTDEESGELYFEETKRSTQNPLSAGDVVAPVHTVTSDDSPGITAPQLHLKISIPQKIIGERKRPRRNSPLSMDTQSTEATIQTPPGPGPPTNAQRAGQSMDFADFRNAPQSARVVDDDFSEFAGHGGQTPNEAAQGGIETCTEQADFG